LLVAEVVEQETMQVVVVLEVLEHQPQHFKALRTI
jgi:hypothetical protein